MGNRSVSLGISCDAYVLARRIVRVVCRDIHVRVCTCAFAPLLFGLRSASKRARSHGTKPSFDALFRCFQWRVYNTGDGTSCIHRTCAHSPVSQRVLEPYSRSVFVSPLLQGLPPLSTSLPSPFSLLSPLPPSSPSILRRVSFCEKHA